LFILFAAISILYQAIERILNQKALENATEGLILITASALVNLSLAYFLYKKARLLNSSILFFHATHIFTDVWTTVGTMIAIVIADKFRILILDPIVGIVIGINVVYLGYKIIKTSLSSLLDKQIEREKIERIEELIENVLAQTRSDHLDNFSYCIKRTRRAGRKGFIELYLNVPSYLSVKDAHKLCDKIEREIKTIFPEIEVIIHVEPSP
jgi:cation diffusion facilitator family transporter